MSIKNMVQHAREGNLVRFQRSFKEAIAVKLPAAINNERAKMADRLFHPRKNG